jgi:hypothetical protein
MSFLAPAALFGIALLALPVLVHLFKPRKMRQTPFSSLRWLKQTRQRLSRRIQWHQWLLFLTRAGIIALLVLALARPLLNLGAKGQPTDRFVVVDVGQGMGAGGPGQASPLNRAQDVAADLLQRAPTGDRTALILAGARPRLVTGPVPDASGSVPALKAARASAADARLSAALPLVRSLLPKDQDRDAEVVFLTDNRASAWRQDDIQAFLKDLPRPVRVRVIEVGRGSTRAAWVADARLLPAEGDEGQVLRVRLGCSAEGAQSQRVRVSGVPGLPEDSQSVTLRPGQVTRVDFKIPPTANLEGQAAEVRLDLPDDSPGGRFFVNLDPAAGLRLLLVEPEARGRAGRRVGLYLQAALSALATRGEHALALTSRTEKSLSAADVAKADLVLLAGVPELAGPAVEALEKRVRAGAGLVVFLGDHVKAEFYNRKLFNPQQAAEGLLPVPLKVGPGGSLQLRQGGLLTDVRWRHPLLAALRDPVYGDLTRATFERYAAFAAAPGDKDIVLARFDNEIPALIEHPVGAGRVLVFNTSADVAWADLPRRPGYVPLLGRLLSYLSSGGVPRSFPAGEPATLPLRPHTPGAPVVVITPDGEQRTPRLLHAGGQTLLHLDEAAEPGVYRVEQGGQKTGLFVVNATRGAGLAEPMYGKVLREWWSPAAFETLTAEEAARRSPAAEGHWLLSAALALLAGLLLLLEIVYVTLLCPRVNPAVVDSVVHRRGLLQPVSTNPSAEAPAAARPS